MSLETLKELQTSGKFHHATYRNEGTVWEGLYVYQYDATQPRGFSLAFAFNKQSNPEEMEEAMKLVKGVSVGSYGNG